MPVKTGREQAAPAGALNAGRCNALFVFIVQEDIAGSFQSEAVGMPRKGADMAQNNTKMRTWFAGKDEPALNLPGGDRRALLNADAHLKSTLLGSSATLEVDEGKLGVGSTGYVYFVDFDRAEGRNRKCKIIIIGE